MTKVYILENAQAAVDIDSDTDTRLLSTSVVGSNTIDFVLAKGGGVDDTQWLENSDTALTRTSTGTFSVEANVTSAGTQTRLRARFHRVNASGVSQASSTYTAYQASTSTGVLTFTDASSGLGTWLTTDMLGVQIEGINDRSSGPPNVTVTITIGTTDAEVSTPFTSPVTQDLTPGLFTNANIFYAPQLDLVIFPGLFTNVNVFYAPAITTGVVDLTPSRFDETNIFYAPTVVSEAVDLTPSRFDETNIFYAPTITTGAVDLTPSRFDETNIFYAPTAAIPAAFRMASGLGTEGNTTERLAMDQTFSGGKFGETVNPLPTVDLGVNEDREDVWSMQGTAEATALEYEFRVLYGGVVANVITATPKATLTSSGVQNLLPTLFTNVNIFYAPAITTGAVDLTPGLFTNVNIFYAPSLTIDLTPGLFTNVNIFYAPSVTTGAVDLTPSRFDETNIFYGPTVTTGVVDLTPSRFDETNIFYAPTVAVGAVDLTPSRFDETNIFYAPTVVSEAVDLTPSRFDETNIFYAPTVAVGAVDLTPSRFDETNIFYAPTVAAGAVTLTPSRFDETNIFYAPSVTTGAVDLTPSRFDETNIFYVPVVVLEGAPQTLTPTLFTNANIFYAPTVAAGVVDLTPSRFDETNIFYAPAVTTGVVALTPSRFDETNIFYAPTVAAGVVDLTPSRFDETNIFYAATVVAVAAPQELTPDLFTNVNIFYAATVATAVVTPSVNILPSTQGGALPPWPTRQRKKKKKELDECLPEDECPIEPDTVVYTPAQAADAVLDVETSKALDNVQETAKTLDTAIAAAFLAATQVDSLIPKEGAESVLSAEELEEEEIIIRYVSLL